ncbi:hypothetical protein PINS_up023893 [Pythium insidiosum]|nr:hypothetical protein PINS_up023893 [Pythium insidiosum]
MRFDECWQRDAQVEEHFSRLQWRVVRVQADGNCLFRALSDQFYGTEDFHTEIRQVSDPNVGFWLALINTLSV